MIKYLMLIHVPVDGYGYDTITNIADESTSHIVNVIKQVGNLDIGDRERRVSSHFCIKITKKKTMEIISSEHNLDLKDDRDRFGIINGYFLELDICDLEPKLDQIKLISDLYFKNFRETHAHLSQLAKNHSTINQEIARLKKLSTDLILTIEKNSCISFDSNATHCDHQDESHQVNTSSRMESIISSDNHKNIFENIIEALINDSRLELKFAEFIESYLEKNIHKHKSDIIRFHKLPLWPI